MRLTVTDTTGRLDQFLLRHVWQGLGRREAAHRLATSTVRVNGRLARKGARVHPGDEVSIEPGPPVSPSRLAAPLPLRIVYRDARLLAIDKPPGIPSVAGRHPGPSAEAMVASTCPELPSGGLVHRIDTGTSGLLLAARTLETYRRLRREFAQKSICKTYIAVVQGKVLHAGSVSSPLRRRKRGRARMVPANGGRHKAWPAHTDFAPVCSASNLTLLRLHMRTGVTHQLRVHMAMLGYPILGDERYGGERAAAGWHYLHAAALRFDSGEWPADLATGFPQHWHALFEMLGWSSLRWTTEICIAP